MADQPGDLVQSVSRALRVLEEVSRLGGPVPVKVVARRTGLNLSTTYHLIRTLAFEGYLVRHPDGRYSVGPEIGRRYRDLMTAFGHQPEAHQMLVHVAAATEHSAYLGRFVDGRVAITDVVEGPHSPYLEDLEVGLAVAAHATAVGKALLSTLQPQQRRLYLTEQGMRPFTSRTATDMDEFEAEVRALVPGRAVFEHGEFRPGWSCAAVLVPRQDPRDPWWALSVSARAEDVPADVCAKMIDAAGSLSEAG